MADYSNMKKSTFLKHYYVKLMFMGNLLQITLIELLLKEGINRKHNLENDTIF